MRSPSTTAARSAGDAPVEIRCLLYDALAQGRLGKVEAVRALDAEIDELEDTYGYCSLILSNRAWLASRAGEIDTAEALATRAVSELSSESHAGVSTFQWVARFPLLAVDVGRGRLTDESQQPLRPSVRALLEALFAQDRKPRSSRQSKPAGWTDMPSGRRPAPRP